VAMPLLVAPTIASLGVAPDLLGGELETQVLSDAAIAERIELAVRALTTEPKGWT
jgi:hypothetical protein